jgi:uncharacterized protein (DUF362 family)/Pyruvate/2-oxoacid:ferredoxin oxidoreductase delta subunit
MSDNKVSYIYCENYEEELINNSITKMLSTFTDLNKKLEAKKLNILIKPNLLAPRHPDKAVTTHPMVIKAIIRYLQKFDCNITIADSPAGTYNLKTMEKLYKTCEIQKFADETGCNLNYDLSDVMVEFPDGIVFKKSLIIKPAVEADLIINVAKLKTHTLTRLTCATKNLFGLMPGVLKYRQHLAMPDIKIFSQMIIDMNKYFEDKVFNIVDGIVGMEGEGPSGGDPKFAGALLAGYNSQAVDVIACKIMGMPPLTVSTLAGYKEVDKVELIKLTEMKTYNFILPPERIKSLPDYIPNFVQNFLTEIIIAKPLINKKTCKSCGICVKSCPAEIITMNSKGAYIKTYKSCIKCYCCQEACPYKSIQLSKPLLERIYRTIRKIAVK